MNLWTNHDYLRHDQYRDGENLKARVELHRRFSTHAQEFWEWVFDRLAIPDEANILELGGGTGLLWLKNRRRIPRGWNITFSDLSLGMIREAAGTLGTLQNRIRYAQINIECIPAESNSYDAVFANHMLYHVPDRAKALREVRRVLKPGGRFYATTVGKSHLLEIKQMRRRFFPAQYQYLEVSEGFTLENGAEQLKACFSKVQQIPYPCDLRITEAIPLINFVLSLFNENQRAELQIEIAAFAEYVRGEIASHGELRVRKAAGLFVAE